MKNSSAKQPSDMDLTWAAQELAELICNSREFSIEVLRTAILLLDPASKSGTLHPLFRRRDCPVCASWADSGEQTIATHCDPATGIVQQIEATAQPVGGTYYATAIHVNPLPVSGARPLLRPVRSYGRGLSASAALNGCIGEALERYSLVYRGDEPSLRARIDEVSGLHPSDIQLYSDQQYANRENWNATTDDRYHVPEPFDSATPIGWLPAVNLQTGEFACAPAACSLMWYSVPAGEPEFARADSIGCASGYTIEDALLGAMFEAIERDAVAIWWYNRLSRPRVVLESFDDPEILALHKAMEQVGRRVFLLDVTTDIALPSFVSVSVKLDGTGPLFASASNLSPRLAAIRALTEVSQMWFTVERRKEIEPEVASWLVCATLDNQSYLQPVDETCATGEPETFSRKDNLRACIASLSRVGLTPYVVDLSRPDVLLRTVRVFAPGLRHVWNRRAPGRLYDVPVKLGWLQERLAETDLNSICCMI